MVDEKIIVAAAGFVIADLDWINPCPEKQFYFAVVLDVMPIN